jgi:hypothetical protein
VDDDQLAAALDTARVVRPEPLAVSGAVAG